MLKDALAHWKSTVLGLAGAALIATAATANIDSMTAAQFAGALGMAFLTALKGLVAADASKVEPPK